MTGLSDELSKLNTEGWSTRDIERIAERHGHKLHYSTVSNYMAGRHAKPSPRVLEAFAAVFGVHVNRIRAAADLPGLDDPFELEPDAARLTGPQRDAVRRVVRQFIEANDAASARPPHDDVDDDAVPDGATTTDDWDLAADEGHRSLDEDDARASRLGEESQDPGDWR